MTLTLQNKPISNENARPLLTDLGDMADFILGLKQGDLVCVGPDSEKSQWPVHRIVSGPFEASPSDICKVYYQTMFGAVHQVGAQVIFPYSGSKRNDIFLEIPNQYKKDQ